MNNSLISRAYTKSFQQAKNVLLLLHNGGPKATSIETGYETWICRLCYKILLTWTSMLTKDVFH
jgi:hypothetical protein